MYMNAVSTEIVCSVRNINMQLVRDNRVEFVKATMSLLQYYIKYVLGFPIIFYVDKPLTF